MPQEAKNLPLQTSNLQIESGVKTYELGAGKDPSKNTRNQPTDFSCNGEANCKQPVQVVKNTIY